MPTPNDKRMVAKNFYFDADMVERLDRIAKKFDIPQAGIVRRAVKQYLDKIEAAGGLTV